VLRDRDPGYFPRGDSVLRRVHGAKVVGFIYGQRALLLQATHPLAFTGLIANTDGLEAPFGRLARTAKTMERVFFGTREEADRLTARVRRAHSRVSGSIDRPAGPHPAGSTYRADDPQFLLWILATLADSAEATYETFVRRLGNTERERFWRDYVLLGELFGLPRSEAPATYGEFRSWFDGQLAGDALFVTEEARDLGRRVAFELPVPASRRGGLAAVNLAVLGLLPPRVRELYGLGWSPAQQAAFHAMSASSRASARVTPARLRRGSCARDYDVVARTEASRLGAAA
jgi:uncharacterized protein (DUF2236 family)